MQILRFLKTLLKTALIVFTGIGASFISLALFFFFFAAVGAGLAGVSTESTPESVQLEFAEGTPDADVSFLSVPITGMILGDPIAEGELTEFFLDGTLTYGYQIKELLRLAADREDIAGVILEVNSPGGTIYGSKAIADGVREYRERTGKPVHAFVSGVAASGGYWAAASADSIVADAGTATGSIGVIAGPFKFYDGVVSEDGGAFVGGVVTAGGIETTYITAGDFKDLGNPYRQIAPEERSTLQEMADQSYTEFVQFVAQRRSLDEAVLRTRVRALIYGEQQAQDLGLIDLTGSRQDAYAELAQAAGVSGEFQVLREVQDTDFFSSMLGVVQQWGNPRVSSPIRGCPLSSVMLAYHGDVRLLCR